MTICSRNSGIMCVRSSNSSPGSAVDDDFEVAGKQAIPQFLGVCITEPQFKPFVAHLESRNKIDNLVRRYRAHDSKLERHLLELTEILRQALCLDRGLV